MSGTATGIPPFTYQWFDTTNQQVVGTTAKVDVSIAGTTTYRLLVTDSIGCTNSVLKTIIMNPIPAQPIITSVKDSLFSTGATTYKWYLGTTVIAGATKQKYVPTASGIYSVRTTNSSGCDTISKPFTFTLISAGAENTESQTIVRLYPNPATGQITFDYNNNGDLPLELSISDVLGNTVYQSSRKAGENASAVAIDIRSFAKGTYFLHYSFGAGFSTLKFVKE